MKALGPSPQEMDTNAPAIARGLAGDNVGELCVEFQQALLNFTGSFVNTLARGNVNEYDSNSLFPSFILQFIAAAQNRTERAFPGHGHVALSGLVFLRCVIPLIQSGLPNLSEEQKRVRITVSKVIQSLANNLSLVATESNSDSAQGTDQPSGKTPALVRDAAARQALGDDFLSLIHTEFQQGVNKCMDLFPPDVTFPLGVDEHEAIISAMDANDSSCVRGGLDATGTSLLQSVQSVEVLMPHFVSATSK